MMRTLKLAFAVLTVSLAAAHAQTAQPAASMEKRAGVWIEGPGSIVTYGKPYDECAQRCLANAGCKMIEYYRPQKKCNQYTEARPALAGGDSFVGTKK